MRGSVGRSHVGNLHFINAVAAGVQGNAAFSRCPGDWARARGGSLFTVLLWLVRRNGPILCEIGLKFGTVPIPRPNFVNETRFPKTGKPHISISQTHRQRVSKIMWLPTPIYERIPQFWFLLGILFIASGVYLGFEFHQSFWYLGIGFVCWLYGGGIFLLRLHHRSQPRTAEQTTASIE